MVFVVVFQLTYFNQLVSYCLSMTFYRWTFISPYKWNNSTEYCEMFSKEMFAGLTKLTNISYMFYFCVIPANVIVPVEFVIDCINLQDISCLFLAAQFKQLLIKHNK